MPEIMDIYFSDRTHDKKIYLLADPADISFVQDGTRDGEKIREWMFHEFQKKLDQYGLKYHIIKSRDGHKDDYDHRFEISTNIIDEFVSSNTK